MFEEEARDRIPPNLGSMAPGPALGAWLSAVDRSRLNGHDLVIVMQAQARQVAHGQAELMATMVEVAYCAEGGPQAPVARDEEVAEFAADEIRVALTLTRRSAEAELDLALRLKQRLPAVWGAVHVGLIDLRRARVLADGTDHVDETGARLVTDQTLDGAGELTTGQLRALLRRLCIDSDPEDANQRYRHSVTDRRVFAEPDPDGTATLIGLQLPPERVSGVMHRINRIARSLRTSAEGRTMDQLRADVYLDLLEGTQPAGRTGRDRGLVDIRVNLATLAGLTDQAGEIPGWGPVIADIARQVTAAQPDAEWRATVTDDAGRVIWDGTTRRRPTAEMTRSIQARHVTCVFPGCRMPARDCDLDHRQPWVDGGATTPSNLAPVCRHDHNVKGSPGWHIEISPNDDYIWTSRLGHTYVTTSEPP